MESVKRRVAWDTSGDLLPRVHFALSALARTAVPGAVGDGWHAGVVGRRLSRIAGWTLAPAQMQPRWPGSFGSARKPPVVVLALTPAAARISVASIHLPAQKKPIKHFRA